MKILITSLLFLTSQALMAQKTERAGGPSQKMLDKIPKMVTIGKIEKINLTYNYVILAHPKDAPLRYGETLAVGKSGGTGQLTISKIYREYTVAEIAEHPKQAIEVGTLVMGKASQKTPKPESQANIALANDLRADDWKNKILKEIDDMEIIRRRNLVLQSTMLTTQAAKLLADKKKAHPESIDKLVMAEKMLTMANGHHPKLTALRKTLGNSFLEVARHQFDLAKKQTWDTHDKAESNAKKALHYDAALKSQVQLLTNSIEVYRDEIKTKPKPKAGELLQKRLNKIVIPKISLKDTPVSIVFEVLKNHSRALDPTEVGVNFLFRLPKGKEVPIITIDLTNAELGSVIKHVCNQAGYTYQVGEKAILIGDFKPIEETKSKSEQSSPASAGK